MISTTPTLAPADLLGLGGFDVRPAYGPGLCSGVDRIAAPLTAPIAMAQGTALPAGGAAVRLRLVTRPAFGHVVTTKSFENQSFENNGTTLGNLSPGRPQS